MLALIKTWLARKPRDPYQEAFADILKQEPARQRRQREDLMTERSRRIDRQMGIHIDDIVELLEEAGRVPRLPAVMAYADPRRYE